MAHLINKDALVAEIKSRISNIEVSQKVGLIKKRDANKKIFLFRSVLSLVDTLEVKEVGISIPNIDDTLKEEGLDPDSKEAKVFKESYYMALEKLKAQKGEEV